MSGTPGVRVRPIGPPAAVRTFVAWALALLLLQLLGLGGTPLFDVDEGAFSEATRELLASGDWGHTTLNGEPRFDKPILIYWLQALSVTLFGLDAFALRLPSALAAWAWAVAVGAFAMARWGVRAGVCAGTVLATSLGVALIGRAATADALLNLWLALAALDLWRAIMRTALRRAALWIGLGLLTKGPVALLVPGAALALWLAVEGWRRAAPASRDQLAIGSNTALAAVRVHARRGRIALRYFWQGLRPLLTDRLAWALLLAVAVPWYAYALQRHGQAFIDGFLWRHNLQRYGGTLEGHGGAWFYYLALLPVLLLPWSALLLSVRWRALWAEPLGRYLLLWAGFVLVFFSGSGTKLPHYLLYGLTPLALLLGRALARPELAAVPGVSGAVPTQQPGRSALTRRLLAISLIALPLLGMLLLEGVRALARHDALGAAAALQAAQLGVEARTWLLWLSAGGTALLIASIWNPVTAAPGVWRPLAGAALGLLFTLHGLLPWWGERLQAPVRDLAHAAQRWQADAAVAAHTPDAAPPSVVQWGLHQPSFSVYLGQVSPRRAPQFGELALVRCDRLAELAQARQASAGTDLPSAASPWTVLARAPGLLLIRWDGTALQPPTRR